MKLTFKLLMVLIIYNPLYPAVYTLYIALQRDYRLCVYLCMYVTVVPCIQTVFRDNKVKEVFALLKCIFIVVGLYAWSKTSCIQSRSACCIQAKLYSVKFCLLCTHTLFIKLFFFMNECASPRARRVQPPRSRR